MPSLHTKQCHICEQEITEVEMQNTRFHRDYVEVTYYHPTCFLMAAPKVIARFHEIREEIDAGRAKRRAFRFVYLSLMATCILGSAGWWVLATVLFLAVLNESHNASFSFLRSLTEDQWRR